MPVRCKIYSPFGQRSCYFSLICVFFFNLNPLTMQSVLLFQQQWTVFLPLSHQNFPSATFVRILLQNYQSSNWKNF